MKKIAIYARVSTGLQVTDGGSLDIQVDLCHRKISDLGLSLAEIVIFSEEGASGEDIDRPAFNRLRNEVAAGCVSHIIVTHPDRLSRDLTDKLFICREFEVHDVKLIFVDTDYQTTPEGMLFFNLMSVIAQYELSLIKKRTIRGRLRAVEKEKKVMPMRVAPFGYELVDQTLVINEEEAAVVRKIYNWYIYDRLTLRQIGEKLYEMGISPKRGESKNWGASSIGKILNSEIYIGKYYYNRRRFKKVKGMRTKGGNPKKTYDYRKEEEWLMVSIPHIVEPAVFELARKQREINFTRSGNNKYEYLLNTKIKCAICGRKWSATTYSGRQGMKYTCYRCPNHAPKRYGPEVKPCPAKTIRGDLLDNYVWSLVMEFLSTPEEYIEQLKETSELVVGELIQAIAVVEKDIKDKTSELERVKTLFKHGVINEEEMLTEYHKLIAVMQRLDEDIKKYNAQLQTSKQEELTSEAITELTEKVQEFIKQNGQQLNHKEKRFVIDSLIDEILIKYIEDDVILIIVGHLGALQDNSVQKGVIIQRAFKLVSSGRRHEKKIIPIEHNEEE